MAIKRVNKTFTGDGSSAVFRADPEFQHGGTVKVGFTLSGTWNSVTATLQKCDSAVSPLSYVAVTSAAYTANASGVWELAVGETYRVTVSASGSPIPNVTFRAVGYLLSP